MGQVALSHPRAQIVAMTCTQQAIAIAQRQHGLVASYQLRSEATRSAIRHEFAQTERWDQTAPGVFQLRGAPATDWAALSAAVLSYGPGSVVSHHSAASLWRWAGFNARPTHVVRPKSTNSKSPILGAVRHESRRMPGEDLTIVEGLPVTTPSRTLVDLSEVLSPSRIERMLDNSWSRRLVDATSLTECCERLGRRGRRGIGTIRSLLAARGAEWTAPASNLESRVNSILSDANLGCVERQANIGGVSWLGRVDFLHPSGVVLEVQSEMFHSSFTAVLDDQRRIRAIEVSGFAVVEVKEEDVWHRPEVWLEEFRQAIRRRSLRSA